MRAAAELRGKISHTDNADTLAVLFSEQCHCAGLLRFIERHDFGANRQSFRNLFIHNVFNSAQFFLSHRLEMREVESCSVSILIGAGLLDMGSQYIAQRLLQKVRGGVIAAGCHAVLFIHCKRNVRADGKHTACHAADVRDFTAGHMLGRCYLKGSSAFAERSSGIYVFRALHDNDSLVADLAAHRSVERRLFSNNRALLPVGKSRNHFIFFILIRIAEQHHRGDPRIRRQRIVADEFGIHRRIQLLVNRRCGTHIGRGIAGSPAVFSRGGSLFVHRGTEALFVNRKALLYENFLRVVQRETISIVEPERVLSGKLLLTLCGKRRFHFLENIHALLICLLELLFLGADDVQNEIFFLLEFRITVLRGFNDIHRECRQERAFNTELSAVSYRTADNSAQHIASSVIGGHNAVGNHKRHRSRVIRADTDRNIRLFRTLLLIADTAGQLADQIAEALKRINIKDRTDVLHCYRETLETHAGINVLLGQIRVMSVAVIVEL